jgi:Putative DNA-binding domain
MPDLAASQRWLQRAILAPADGADLADANEILASSAGLTGGQRLNIYRRGYRLRLLEAMRGLYPGLRTLLGPELFDDFALEYLDACPSRSRSMADLGRRLAGYLAAQRPDRAEPPARREAWIGVVIDLARYEQVFSEVYDGPGTEGRTAPGEPLPLPEDPDGAVTLAPGLRALRLRAPVHAYCAAVRGGQVPAPPESRPVRLVLSRRDFVVVATELPTAPHRFLSALLADCPVRSAARLAGAGTTDVGRWLRGWAGCGWLVPGERSLTSNALAETEDLRGNHGNENLTGDQLARHPG